MKIATWNINGVRARIGNLLAWLKESTPDIVCLQEIKSADDQFPRLGDRSARLSCRDEWPEGLQRRSHSFEAEIRRSVRGLPGDDADDHARFIEGVFSTEGGVLRVVSLYLPNGNPIGTAKFTYKLGWMARLERWASERLALEEPLVLGGDYNVIPQSMATPEIPENWVNDALFQPESRQALRRLVSLGFTDATRAVTDSSDVYTFWDYQAGAWQKNNGIRIDFQMLSPEAANLLRAAGVEKHVRSWEKPSDHVPVTIELAA